MQSPWIAIGAVWAGLAVALGAFGAHGLEKWTALPEAHEWWATAADYHFGHGLALVLFGLFERGLPSGARGVWTGRLLLVGSLIFSGTLYAMALGGPKFLGAVTPIGGVLLIAGWICFALQAYRSQASPDSA